MPGVNLGVGDEIRSHEASRKVRPMKGRASFSGAKIRVTKTMPAGDNARPVVIEQSSHHHRQPRCDIKIKSTKQPTTTNKNIPDMLLPLLLLACALICGVPLARANCEHAHFHAPPAVTTQISLPAGLSVLTPTVRSLKAHLLSRFPSAAAETETETETEASVPAAAGVATWFLLDELVPGQRYETRACYAATVSVGGNMW